ncbi:methyltransferase domain-containing protein [Rubinisphaera sp.]|uniref:class I SAM-dependent methyltransferase n=1 Tax=Rubinisphaera sp. TaxID=2024857 RepID=UPI000C0F03AD|nr:methyltransferase domain-containing protein [Rubinisphaera sp.]MBV11022.1 hypothetical protein [Rubinisphaera sp.]HCS54392.1 hypothetical protein [Planctomycetaceae bacterium]
MTKAHKTSLPDCIDLWRDEEIDLGVCTLQLTIPEDPDALLDRPEVLEENRQTDYVPYWAYLWPAARSFANIMASLNDPPAKELLEIGCGCGLVGLAAMTNGIKTTLSDNRLEALQLSEYNAKQNNLSNYELLQLDWFHPPKEKRWDWVIASDVLYEARFHEPLLDALTQLIKPGGQIWIGDPGRALVLEFVRLAQQRGWEPLVYDADLQLRSFPTIGHFQLLVFKIESEEDNIKAS